MVGRASKLFYNYSLYIVNTADVAFATTNFVGFGGNGLLNPTEVTRQTLSNYNQRFTRLKVRVTGNSLDGITTITLRINGIDTSMLVTFAALEIGIKTLDLSVPVLENDLITFSVVTAGTLGVVSVRDITVSVVTG